MGFFSKLWKGVKKVVKKVAKTVKKVAKKVAHAIPGGKKLWKIGTKIGKGIMKGIGKITKALGPVGMFALSFVIGPAAGALWSSFGAGAATMAASANAFVSTLGSIGSGIFAAGNFVAGTLGAVGEAIMGGAKNVMAGNFSGAASTFASNMGSALTGEAGMAAVNAGASAAASSVLTEGAATGINAASPTSAELFGATPGAPLADLGANTVGGMPTGAELFGTAEQVAAGTVPTSASVIQGGAGIGADAGVKAALKPNEVFGTMDSQGNIVNSMGSDSTSSTLDNIKKAKSLLDTQGEEGQIGGFTPQVASLKSVTAANAFKGGGTGSSGFSLLGGVQGLEQSVRASQQRMFA